MVTLDGGMPAASVSIDDHRAGAIERIFHMRPAVGVNGDVHAFSAGEALLEEKTTGAEFVVARPVALPAGDENDVLVRSGGLMPEGDGQHNDLEGENDLLHGSLIGIRWD